MTYIKDASFLHRTSQTLMIFWFYINVSSMFSIFFHNDPAMFHLLYINDSSMKQWWVINEEIAIFMCSMTEFAGDWCPDWCSQNWFLCIQRNFLCDFFWEKFLSNFFGLRVKNVGWRFQNWFFSGQRNINVSDIRTAKALMIINVCIEIINVAQCFFKESSTNSQWNIEFSGISLMIFSKQ